MRWSRLLPQPADASTADRNPLPQQRHLKPAAAVDWMIDENSVEPLQKVEFLRSFRPRLVIKAAARNPEPGSALVGWFRERVSGTGRRMRKVMVVAMARRLLIALWQFATQGIVPEGAVMKPTY